MASPTNPDGAPCTALIVSQEIVDAEFIDDTENAEPDNTLNAAPDINPDAGPTIIPPATPPPAASHPNVVQATVDNARTAARLAVNFTNQHPDATRRIILTGVGVAAVFAVIAGIRKTLNVIHQNKGEDREAREQRINAFPEEISVVASINNKSGPTSIDSGIYKIDLDFKNAAEDSLKIASGTITFEKGGDVVQYQIEEFVVDTGHDLYEITATSPRFIN